MIEKLKKYWKEIGLVVLVIILALNYFKGKVSITTATQTEIDSVRVKQALEGLKVYQDFLNEKRENLQKEQEELEKLEAINTPKVVEAKQAVTVQKTKYNAKKTKYKASTSTASLDSLIRVYSKGG
jgi:ABC-type transporter Mla subunit MlaD